MFHDTKYYDFIHHKDYEFMWIATLAIAISLTMTTTYLIFYSQSQKLHDHLETADYMGKTVMLFGFTFAFIGSSFATSPLEFFFLVLVVAALAINLIILQYDYGRVGSFWISVALFATVYLYDFWVTANSVQKNVFYIPMFVEAIALALGFVLYKLEVPDRFCRGSRFVQLCFTGWVFFTIFYISAIYEAHNILYYTLKANRGNFNIETDDWWEIKNLFYQDKK